MSKFSIIGCPKWEAVPPANGFNSIVWTSGSAQRIIFHHTAGHHPEITQPGTESVEESIRYARDIQTFHMKTNGWNDSGHNFLVCRNGVILQGRWRTIRAIQHQRMVVSAHCPGQNDQIGIEHEHFGNEEMPLIQKEASAWLQAWIAKQYDLRQALPVFPHSRFFPTNCPANLIEDIGGIRAMANRLLSGGV